MLGVIFILLHELFLLDALDEDVGIKAVPMTEGESEIIMLPGRLEVGTGHAEYSVFFWR